MKFGKRLRQNAERSFPEWKSKWVAYKMLKKSIPDGAVSLPSRGSVEDQPAASRGDRAVESVRTGSSSDGHSQAPHDDAAGVAHFVNKLSGELDKVNEFYLDKEEDHIIRYDFLTSRVTDALVETAPSDPESPLASRLSRPEHMTLKRDLVDFHGELVLLENYSTMNCTGFRKILKKHDKKSGSSIQRACLPVVLVTPVALSRTVPELMEGTEELLKRMDRVTKFRRAALTTRPPGEAPPAGIAIMRSTLQLGVLMDKLRSLESRGPDPAAADERILRVLDGMSLVELGVPWPNILASVDRTTSFMLRRSEANCEAGKPALTVGCIVVPPGATFQVISEMREPVLAKVLAGRALFRRHRLVKQVKDGEEEELELELHSDCQVVAPWPGFRFWNELSRHEWTAVESTLILYATRDLLFGNEDWPLYTMNEQNRHVCSTNFVQEVLRMEM